MVTMNKPASGTQDWYQAITNNWITIQQKLLDMNLVAAKGDMVAASAPGTMARVPVGVDGSILLADSTQPAGLRWSTVSTLWTPTVSSALATTAVSTSSNTWTDMDSMTLSPTLTGNPTVLAFWNSTVGDAANFAVMIQLLRDGVVLAQTSNWVYENWRTPLSLFAFDQPGSGAHTYKIQWMVNTGFTMYQDLQPYSTLGDRALILIVIPG